MAYYADKAAAIADGVLHYWPFDDAANPDVIEDRVGTYHGNVRSDFSGPDSSVAIVDSPLNKARDGVSHGVSSNADLLNAEFTANPTDYPSSTRYENITFRIRVKPHSLSSNRNIAWIGRVGSQEGGARLYTDSGNVYLITYDAADQLASTVPMVAGQWSEIVLTYEYGYFKLYMDGALADSSNYSVGEGQLDPYFETMIIGGKKYSNDSDAWQYAFDGVVDEAALWNRTLNAAEILALYNSGTAVSLLEPEIPPTPLLEPFNGVVTYEAKLTGAADSLPDLDLSISSFNARVRSARDSYLSVIVPNTRSIAAEIEARPNGDIVLYQNIDSALSELVAVNLHDVTVYEGSGAGYTVSLSGYKQKTYATPDRHEIACHSYYSKAGSKSRIRAPIMYGVQPADTIQSNGVEFVVDTVTLIGNSSRAYMEVSE